MNITVHHSGSSGNLIQVDDILIEAGVPIKEIKRSLGFRLSEIQACLVSHSHGDHAKGLKDLLKAGVDCYCSWGTSEALHLEGHRLHIIGDVSYQFKVGPWDVKSFPVVHDAPGSLGFLIAKGAQKLLYACDTNYIPYRFRGLTHILLGVDYDSEILKDNIANGTVNLEVGKRILTNHMSLQTAIKFFKANDMSKVREIYLLHLSNDNSDAERFKSEIEQLTGRPVYVA